MIWFIIGFIVFVILTVISIRDGYDWCDYFLMPIAYFFMCVLISGVVALTVSAGMSIKEAVYEKVSDTEIIALKDNQSAHGHFYLMGGYVDEDLYYYYAEQTELGYKTNKVKANNSFINYTDKRPHIEEYVGDFEKSWYYVFGFPMYENRYIIYCPDGTVTNEYKVDLE